MSTKEIKNLIKHIDLSGTKEAERLLRYDEFDSFSLWAFGIMIVYNALEKTRSKTTKI